MNPTDCQRITSDLKAPSLLLPGYVNFCWMPMALLLQGMADAGAVTMLLSSIAGLLLAGPETVAQVRHLRQRHADRW